MTSSMGLASCLPSPFWYVFLLLSFFSISNYFHSCTLVTFKGNICIKRALLSVLFLILSVCLGRSMPTTLMAFLRSVLLVTIQMSRATFSLMHTSGEFYFILVLFPFYSCIRTFVLATFPSKVSLLFRSVRSSFSCRQP